MTSGTKVLLAVIGLFVGVLIAYYGFFLSPEAPPTAEMRDPAMEAPAEIARPAGRATSALPPARTGSAVTMGEPTASNARPGRSSSRTVVPLARPSTTERAPRRPVTAKLPPINGAPTGPSDGGKDGPMVTPRGAKPSTGDGVRKSTRGPSANRPAPTVRTRSGAAAATAPPRFVEYNVRAGDTMSHIAEAWFGDETLWDLIAKANPRVDPMRLKIGQVLRLPPRDATRTGAAVPAPPEVGEHLVRSGETLSSIAERHLGSPTEWRRIFEANRRLLGSDPDRLAVGMRLRIPG